MAAVVCSRALRGLERAWLEFHTKALGLGFKLSDSRHDMRMKLSAVRPLVLHDPPDPPKYFVVGGLVFVASAYLGQFFFFVRFLLLEAVCGDL